jgi:hypothetical protein
MLACDTIDAAEDPAYATIKNIMSNINDKNNDT